MIWPPSVRGLLVTEGVRGDGGTLRNNAGERFMFRYIPDFFRSETADNEAEADRWYEDKANNRRTPDLLPRDEVARAINSESKSGKGSPHGGVFLDIATRRPADYIRKRLPSMYHQFMELAGVDITKEAMEIGPTCHYVMGGVRVNADTTATTVPGLFAAGEVAAGLHGANRLGGNSLSDLLVFGRRAGMHAAEYARAVTSQPDVNPEELDFATQELLKPLSSTGGENPYAIHADLQECMQNNVGLIRVEKELLEAVDTLKSLRQRLQNISVVGGRTYNPGWHLALDLQNLLTVSEACTLAALHRKESRGGHTRDDYPTTDAHFGKINVVIRPRNGELDLTEEPIAEMPDDLKELFEEAH
jgi:succinate dehydrogenase / fumarate reductase, flavoprotein subunit